jgi:hypothetical protein
MDGAAGLNSTEELREALLAAGRERDALMLAHVHAQHLLAALESLLRVNAGMTRSRACSQRCTRCSPSRIR